MNGNRRTSEAATVIAAKATQNGKLLKRTEAARLLGMSVSTLRRREGEVLNPIVGEGGVHLFDEAEVRAVMITMRGQSALAAMGPSSGVVASEVFTLLDEDVHPVEIVKRLRLTPEVVTALHKQWIEMRSGFTVSREHALDLGAIGRTGTPSTAQDLISAMRRRIDTLTRMRQGAARCTACHDPTASICEACVVVTRGPVSTLGMRLESRTTEAGIEELRVAADAYWDDVGGIGGAIATLCSDWFAAADIQRAPISEFVAGIQNRKAS
jgi:hypothetical protein